MLKDGSVARLNLSIRCTADFENNFREASTYATHPLEKPTPALPLRGGNRARNNISPFLHLRWHRWGDTSFLLGGRSGERKDGDLAKWKPNLEMIKVCVNYVTATGRLESEQRAYGTETDNEESSTAEHEFDL